eukprot:5559050-Prymnesium_polylepis.1
MAQRSALRHAAARSSAPAPRTRVAHAHQRCGPERHPSNQRARQHKPLKLRFVRFVRCVDLC